MASRIAFEDEAVRIPASALTPDGFRDWVKSEEFPEGIRASFNRGKVVIDAGHDIPPVLIPAAAATFSGFRAWARSDDFPERGHVSFINKEIHVDMSPEELQKHNRVKAEIGSVIDRLAENLNLGMFIGDGMLLTNGAVKLSTVPDGIVVLWDSFESGQARLIARKDHPDEYIELQGTPDWVLEVVSRSSNHKDMRELPRAYFEAGVPEYWHVNALGDEIDFQILWRLDEGYAPATAKKGWLLSRVFARWFRLERKQNDMGYWRYKLRVRLP